MSLFESRAKQYYGVCHSANISIYSNPYLPMQARRYSSFFRRKFETHFVSGDNAILLLVDGYMKYAYEL